ncbi:MAG TPA: hypothetical protein DCQ64_03420 [Candidatus Rokubacteria bacterium]|nr:hypothetical protein [Candidatus Rokubacteria bacterium]
MAPARRRAAASGGRAAIYRSYEIFAADLASGALTRLTDNDGYDAEGAVSPDGKRIVFTSLMHPDPRKIVFSSNLHDPSGRSFALYLIDRDGGGLERLTWTESFASFPMFSRDGSQLVFCSNRGAAAPRDLDVFICDWVA